MTIYLSPSRMTKEEFLQKHGEPVPESNIVLYNLDKHDKACIVCLVDNGPFTAAGILYGELDREAFTSPTDPRPRAFFRVPTSAINEEGGPSRTVT